MFGCGLSRRSAWISRSEFTCSRFLKLLFMHLIAKCSPVARDCAFNTSLNVPWKEEEGHSCTGRGSGETGGWLACRECLIPIACLQLPRMLSVALTSPFLATNRYSADSGSAEPAAHSGDKDNLCERSRTTVALQPSFVHRSCIMLRVLARRVCARNYLCAAGARSRPNRNPIPTAAWRRREGSSGCVVVGGGG